MDFLPWWLQPWKWPEYIVKWWKGIYEIKEARAKALKAEAEAHAAKIEAHVKERGLSNVEWETQVAEMMRKIRKARNEFKAKYPGKNVVPEIKPSPDDNQDVFSEAMRRIMKESG